MHRGRTLVGRDDVLARIERHFAQGGATSQAVVVAGPAGIGKTALVRSLLGRSADLGFVVHHGTARQLEADLSFAPLAEALGLDPRSDDPQRAQLGELVRGEGQPGGDQRRWRILDGIVDVLEQRSRTARVLLVVEDIHWADPDTAAVLARVARSFRDLAVAVLVTSRPEPLPDHIRTLLHDFNEDGALAVQLEPLTAAQVAEVTESVVGAPPTAALALVLERAAGNPLYVLELLRALEAEGDLAVSAEGADARPAALAPSFRLTLIRRLGFLPDETIGVLAAASVLGESARIDRIAMLSGRTTSEVTDALAPAFRSGLLDHGQETVSFRHALIRDALYEDLPGPTRIAMHADAARVLADGGALPSQVATHLALALRPGDVATAGRLLDAASAVVEYSPAVAGSHAQLVLDALPPGDPERLQARKLLAQAAARTGRPDQAEALAHELDNEGLDVTARLELWRTVTFARHLRGEASLTTLDAYELVVREAELPDDARGSHLALVAFALRWELPARAAALVEEVLATEVDLTTKVLALTAAFPPSLMHGEIEEAHRVTEQAVQLVRTAGLEASWVGVEALAAFAFLRSIGVPDGVQHVGIMALHEALDVAGTHGLAYAVPTLHNELARTHWFQGDFDAAVANAETALRAMAETGYGANDATATACAIMGSIALSRGDHAAAAARRAAIPASAIVDTREGPLFAADDQLRRGNPAAAWELVRPVLTWMEEDDPTAFISMIWTLPVVEAALAVGEHATAAAWTDYLERWAASGTTPPIVAVAACARAAVERTPERARAAIAAARAAAIHPFRLSGFRLAGQILAEHGLTADAVAILREGRELAAAANATVLVAEYDALLRDLGVRRGAVGRGRPDTGWEALTEAELRVVELVAQDLTYREVGERLFVSRRTVETHVASARRKLDCANRDALTRAHRVRSS